MLFMLEARVRTLVTIAFSYISAQVLLWDFAGVVMILILAVVGLEGGMF
jgi:hypothetical protein